MVDWACSGGTTPLMRAASNGHVCSQLLAGGARVNTKHFHMKTTPLKYAKDGNKPECAAVLRAVGGTE